TLAIVQVRLLPLREAVVVLERAMEALRDAGEGTLLATMYAWLAITREASGDRAGADLALHALDRFDDVVGVAGSTYRRTAAHAWIAMFRGEWKRARALLVPLVDLSVDASMHVNTKEMRSYVELMCGDAVQAAALGLEAARAGERAGFTAASVNGTRTHIRSLAARALGDLTAAEDLARAALDEHETRPVPAWVRVGPLNVLGSLLIASGRLDDGVRLLGAAFAECERTQVDVTSAMRTADVDGQDDVARAALGEERFAALWQEGCSMTWTEAVAYAQRGRGERRRPKHGWESLTPTERQVVDLVAAGATNNEVAEKLFMAVPTVKTHLTHVYAKLGITTRAQLAALAVRASG